MSGSDVSSKKEDEIEMSKLIIPFSKIFKPYESADIYSGTEKIPFKEKEKEYRMILRQEFANTL